MSLGLALATYGQAVQRVAAVGSRVPAAELRPASVAPIAAVPSLRGAGEAALALLGREALQMVATQPEFEAALRRCVALLEHEPAASAARAADPQAPLQELLGRVLEVYLDRPVAQSAPTQPALDAQQPPATPSAPPPAAPPDVPGQLSLLASAARGQDRLAELLLTTGLRMPATQTAGEAALVEAYVRLAEALTAQLSPDVAVTARQRAVVLRVVIDAYLNMGRELLGLGEGTGDGAGSAPVRAPGPTSVAPTEVVAPRPDGAPAPGPSADRAPGPAFSAAQTASPPAAADAPYRQAFEAIVRGHHQIAEQLAQSGLSPAAPAEYDQPAALRIVLQGHQRIASELLASGVSVPPQDPAVARPAFLSVIEAHQTMAARLLAGAADAQSLSPIHQTALLRTVLDGHRAAAADLSQAAAAPPEPPFAGGLLPLAGRAAEPIALPPQAGGLPQSGGQQEARQAGGLPQFGGQQEPPPAVAGQNVREAIRQVVAARLAAQGALPGDGRNPPTLAPDRSATAAGTDVAQPFAGFRALRAQQMAQAAAAAPGQGQESGGSPGPQSLAELLVTHSPREATAMAQRGWVSVRTDPGAAPGMPAAADVPDAAGQAPLHRAAEYGAVEPIRELLGNGASVDRPNAAGETPLLVAARSAKPEAARVLLEAGANVDARDMAYGETALHKAAMIGQPELARVLIAHGADLNAQSKAGSTPLHIAATAKREEVARILLAAGADVNARDALGLTPLHRAVSLDAPELVKLLLAYGADAGIIGEYLSASLELLDVAGDADGPGASAVPMVRHAADGTPGAARSISQAEIDPGAVDGRGRTLLHHAVAEGDLALAKELLLRGADANAAARFGETPLHLAVARNRPEMIELLLSRGANVEARDAVAGNTPLHLAATLGRAEATTALLAGGANVNSLGAQGQQPLHIAVGVNHLELVGQLLSAGADPNARTQLGATALSRAAFWGRPEAVQLLTDRGADPNTANAQGRTPLYAAVMDGNDAVAQHLLQQGAVANVQDAWGASPLHWAAARGNVQMAHLLLLNGADAAAVTGAGVTTAQAAQASLNGITAFGLPYSHPRRVDDDEQMPRGPYARDPQEAARQRYEELLWLVEAFAADAGVPEDGSIPLDRAYANITLWGPEREQIAQHIREMSHGAYISPTVGGFTVVFDTACTPERPEGVWSRSADLSATFGCTALGLLSREDGLLQYRLYVAGELVDEYSSRTQDAALATGREPVGGRAEALCQAFGIQEGEAQVEAVLRRCQAADDGPMFEVMRHRELALALGMPLFGVGSGYARMEAHEAVPEAPRELLQLLVQPPAGYPGVEAAA